MGVSCPNETKCLFKVLPSGQMLRQNIYAEFEEKSFSEGAFSIVLKVKSKIMMEIWLQQMILAQDNVL